MGAERFGIFSLTSVFLVYFTFFDFGLGRALTTLVAEKIGSGRHHDISGLVWTASILVAILGVLGAAVVALLAPFLVYNALTLAPDLRGETLRAFYWLAIGVPSAVLTSALTGILTALQRFDVVNAV